MGSDANARLGSKERAIFHDLLPMRQKCIHLAFKSDFTIGKKNFVNDVIILTEHGLSFFDRALLTKKYRIHTYIPLVKIDSIITYSDTHSLIETEDDTKIKILSPLSNKLIKGVLRNYILSVPLMSPDDRFSFKRHDHTVFPAFTPKLSASQKFQLTYNTYCSHYNVPYYHEVVNYYHKLMSSGDPFFDCSGLPLNILESGTMSDFDLRPLARALSYSDMVYGFISRDIYMPEIISTFAKAIKYNATIKVVIINNSHATAGAANLANAIVTNSDLDVSYWDLSRNYLSDIGDFTAVLANYPCEISTLKLDDCSLPSMAICSLFSGIVDNGRLHKIKHISIMNSKIDKNALAALGKYVNLVKPCCSRFGIGPINDVAQLLNLLIANGCQFQEFSLVKTTIKKSVADLMCQFLSSQRALSKINFTGCAFRSYSLPTVLKSLADNAKITSISINLSSMNLSGRQFVEVAKLIKSTSLKSKVREIILDDNKLGTKEFVLFFDMISGMSILKSISLSGNLTNKTTGVCEILDKLFSLKIEKLTVRGSQKKKLKATLVKALENFKSDSSISYLDISDNSIGNECIEPIIKIIKRRKNLRCLSLDGNSFTDFDLLSKYFSAVCDSKLLTASMQYEDLFIMLQDFESRKQVEKIKAVADFQEKVESVLEKNGLKSSIHRLHLLNDENLSSLIDVSIILLHDQLAQKSVRAHSKITDLVGLPLPFEKERPGEKTVIFHEIPDGDYVDDESKLPVQEDAADTKDDADKYVTKHYKSLMTRRSGKANTKLGSLLEYSNAKLSEFDDGDISSDNGGASARAAGGGPSSSRYAKSNYYDTYQ